MIAGWRERLPAAVRWLVTLLLLLVSWVFFFSPTIGAAGAWLKHLAGIGGHGLIDTRALSMVKDYAVLWVIGIFASIPLTRNIYEKALSGTGKWKTAVNCIVYGMVLFLSIAQMIL